MFCVLSHFLHISAGMKGEVPLQHSLLVYRRLRGWAPYFLNLYNWRWVVGSALQLPFRAVVSINYAARWSLDHNFEFPSRTASLCSARSLWFYGTEVRTDKVGGSSECLIINLTRLQMIYRVMWNPDSRRGSLLSSTVRSRGTTTWERHGLPSANFHETRKCLTDIPNFTQIWQ